MPDTLTPIFLAVASNAAARSQESRTALTPCSVKCMVVMKVAIGTFPPQVVGRFRVLYPGRPAPASSCAGLRSARPSERPPPCRDAHPHRGSGYNDPGGAARPLARRRVDYNEGPS